MRSVRIILFSCLLAVMFRAPRRQANGLLTSSAGRTTSMPTKKTMIDSTFESSPDIADDWKMYAMDSPRPSLAVKVTVDSVSAGVTVEGAIGAVIAVPDVRSRVSRSM